MTPAVWMQHKNSSICIYENCCTIHGYPIGWGTIQKRGSSFHMLHIMATTVVTMNAAVAANGGTWLVAGAVR